MLETKVVKRNKRWLPIVWWRRQEVGRREKIRYEGGGFRSEPVSCGGRGHDRAGERETDTKWNYQ
jgi:hypothetical protein